MSKWTYEYRDRPRPCYRIQDGSDDGDVAEVWDKDVAEAIVSAMNDRAEMEADIDESMRRSMLGSEAT